jgi:predicted Na+-dependent transporter
LKKSILKIFINDAILNRERNRMQNVTSSSNDGGEDHDDNDSNSLQLFAIVASNLLLFFLIFGLSATVDCHDLKKQLSNVFAIGTGVALQYLIMPALGCVTVVTFMKLGMTHATGIALMVVTSSPGGSYSNWFCSTFNADLPLSVAMTTVSSLMSVFMLPLNLFFYTWLAFRGESSAIVKSIDFKSLFISLAVVLSAIVSGLTAGYKFDTPRFHATANKLGTVAGVLLIVFSIFISSGGSGAESTIWNQDWTFYIGVLLPFSGGMMMAFTVASWAGLSPPEVVAIAIEICYQNTGIATSVAITMFDNVEDRAQAVAVPLLYGLYSAVLITIFCLFSWKMGVRSDKCSI